VARDAAEPAYNGVPTISGAVEVAETAKATAVEVAWFVAEDEREWHECWWRARGME
jgi:hypothetical protein